GSWGYQPTDNTHKTPYQVIRIFSDMIGNGGNLLLDIAPRADGSIPEIQANILRELGAWIDRNETGIYGTREGIPLEYFYGPTTLSPDRPGFISSLTTFLTGRSSSKVSRIRSDPSVWLIPAISLILSAKAPLTGPIIRGFFI